MYTYIFKSRILILDLKCPWECQVEDQSPRCKTDILIYQTMTQHFAFLDMFEEKKKHFKADILIQDTDAAIYLCLI